MSHFTTVKTKLKDLVRLKLAVEDVGLTLVESEEMMEVRGYQGNVEKSNLIIKATDHYDIGVQQTQEGYTFVADWWGIEMETGLKEKQWVDRLTQRYSYHKVLAEITQRGFTLEEEVNEEGEIRLTVRRWE
jgi:isochorismate hydrolase